VREVDEVGRGRGERGVEGVGGGHRMQEHYYPEL